MPLPTDETGKIKRGPGRPKGSVNKATKAVREFLADLCDDPKVQNAVRRKVLKGETMGFFKAVDKMIPDPPKALNINANVEWMRALPPGDDVAED